MGFLDDVSAFGKGISQKTKDMMDVTSNNNKIAGIEKKINEAYQVLGQKYYSDKISDTECAYQDELNVIRDLMAEIGKIQNENKAIEDAQVAAAKAAAEAKAAAQSAAQEAKAKKQEQIDTASSMVKSESSATCPKCNAPVKAGALFCTACGNKLS